MSVATINLLKEIFVNHRRSSAASFNNPSKIKIIKTDKYDEPVTSIALEKEWFLANNLAKYYPPEEGEDGKYQNIFIGKHLGIISFDEPDFTSLEDFETLTKSLKGKKTQKLWLINGLDGAYNFLNGNHGFCMSVALIENNKLSCCYFYNPVLDHEYHAINGNGAYKNQRRIRVNGSKILNNKLIGINLPDLAFVNSQLDKNKFHPRIYGSTSYSLCLVAEAALCGFFHQTDNPFNHIAASLLIQEAGGQCIDSKQKLDLFNTNKLLAGNLDLVQSLSKKLLLETPK